MPPHQRRAVLLKWLSPKEEGDKEAGRFIGRSTREIAQAFNRRFRTQLSERTVLRYLHEAVEAAKREAEDATRLAAQAGRIGVSVPPPVVTLPIRGRPKSERPPSPRKSKQKPAVPWPLPPLIVAPRVPEAPELPPPQPPPPEEDGHRQEVSPSRPVRLKSKPGPKPRFKRWGRIGWELQALTGWSGRGVYQHLSTLPGMKPHLGSRASFLHGLADLGAPRPSWNPVAATRALPTHPEDAFAEDLRACGVLHVLHLHQVLIQTERGEWALLLLAFDPLSLFINARVLDFEGPVGSLPVSRPRGRPRERYHADWRARVMVEDGCAALELSPEAYWDFIIDTVGKTGIPYGPIWLSLQGAEEVAEALGQISPGDTFIASPVPSWPRAPISSPIALKPLCRLIADSVNAHNRLHAQSRLRDVRERIESLIEKGRVSPATLVKLEETGLYDTRRDHIVFLDLPHPPRQDVRRFALLSGFQAGYPGLAGRGHFVAITPRHIRARFDTGDTLAPPS